MTKTVPATVRNGRVEAEAPAGWPDGTEVLICLVQRPNLTGNDSAMTGAELATIWDVIVQEERASQGEPPTESK
jgi:hypothetical protein